MDWTATPDDAGVRLDKYLAAPERLGSRAKSTAALERGKVFVNEREASIADAGLRLNTGDRVRLWLDRPGSAKARPRTEVGDLKILFEDDSLLVVNKPAGLLAVPLERKAEAPSVFEQLADHFRSRGKRKPL